jgi:hypothetical protein
MHLTFMSSGLNKTVQGILDKIRTEYDGILYCFELCWLSKGKVLQHFLFLLEEMKVFLIGIGSFEDAS